MHLGLEQTVRYVFVPPLVRLFLAGIAFAAPIRCHLEAMTVTLVQFSTGHSCSSRKDNATDNSPLFNSNQVYIHMLSYCSQSTSYQDRSPAWTTHCIRKTLIYLHAGPWVGPYHPSSLILLWSSFGVFRILPSGKPSSGPF